MIKGIAAAGHKLGIKMFKLIYIIQPPVIRCIQ